MRLCPRVIAAFFALTLAACSSSAPTTSLPAATRPPVTAVAQQPSPTPEALAAIVNGQPIPVSALEREVTRRLETLKAFSGQSAPDLAAVRAAALQSLIEQALIEQAAGIQGIVVTEAEVQTEITAIIAIAGSRENWEAQLRAEKLTEAEYAARVRSALITAKMRDVVTAQTCQAVEQVLARHILVADKEKALQIKAELDAGGDFVALAAQHSLDVTTRQTGGDLGWFARGQLLQPQVEEAAFTLPLKVISEPIETELGFHLLQVLERDSNRPVDGETCYRLTEIAFERWLQEIAAKAKIEKF
jgi:parvulin-like peptidyl-prolyl isomerase